MATVTLRCFAAAREAAGTSSASFEAERLDTLLTSARVRFGESWSAVLDTARVWVNGDEPSDGPQTVLHDGDEVAVLPPVSGGCSLGPAASRREPGIAREAADEVRRVRRAAR